MAASDRNTSSNHQSYSQKQVQQIFQRAIAKQVNQGEFSREELLEMAKELDISPESLEAAEKDWFNEQVLSHQRQAFDQSRWRQFKQDAESYVIVNLFLIALNFVIENTISWAWFPLLGWGVG